MRINIKKSDCFFRVDESARKVVCVYTVDPDLIVDYIDDFNQSIGRPTFIPMSDKMYLPPHIVGIATCAEDDVWDEEIGKNVAYLKMKKKLIGAFLVGIAEYMNFHEEALDKLVASCNTLCDQWNRSLNANVDKIRKQMAVHTEPNN